MAARLINGMRGAFHKENWRKVEPEDYLKAPDEGEEDIETSREQAASQFPTTLDRQ